VTWVCLQFLRRFDGGVVYRARFAPSPVDPPPDMHSIVLPAPIRACGALPLRTLAIFCKFDRECVRVCVRSECYSLT